MTDEVACPTRFHDRKYCFDISQSSVYLVNHGCPELPRIVGLVSKRMSKYVFTRGCESIRMLLLIDFLNPKWLSFNLSKLTKN